MAAATLPLAQVGTASLAGRRSERLVLDHLLEAVRAGESRTLVVHGEPGVGKTALLGYLAEQATGFRLLRAVGVETEMELAFAGLHQLLAPVLERVDRLPAPQREALGTCFAFRSGTPPDRFFVGLAALGLLSEVAVEEPLLCLVDDEQWLDNASAQALAFAARRLQAESVAIVFAARTPSAHLAGLPQIAVEGLQDVDARVLLDSLLTAPLDARVRARVVAETRGIPLALIELVRALTPAELAGFGLDGAAPSPLDLEQGYSGELGRLPPPTQRLLRLAAADPTGDPLLLTRAAERLGIPAEAAVPATDAGLIELGGRVHFRHPLVRSAAYRSASARERQQLHRALAEATDKTLDPDRRAWHHAQAAPGPDEDVAAELERAAERAKARGGMTAAAALLERATELTLDPGRLADRALAAAQAHHLAGASAAASRLLEIAEASPLDTRQRAQVSLLHGRIAFASSRGSEAPMLLLQAGKDLEPLDRPAARETYLEALAAATFAGRLACSGGSVLDVALAARAAPPVESPRPQDLLLDGLAAHYRDGYAASVPILRRAVSSFGSGMTAEEELRWLWVAGISALHIWDDRSWIRFTERHVRLGRELGALSELPLALTARLYAHLFAGELSVASALLAELHATEESLGTTAAPYGPVGVAAVGGREPDVTALIDASTNDVEQRGEGIGLTAMAWASALLHNSLGQYQTALAAANRATAYSHDIGPALWALPELVEAAARSGNNQTAIDAHRRLAELTRASDSEWALGLEARAHALVSDGEGAELLYREAIERLAPTRMRVDLGRAHLLHGEWLRRQQRRVDARFQLRAAHELFSEIGADALADRAGRELLATGETVGKRSVETRGDLTAQEAQIARLARDGFTNPEIGTRLFISPRTVQYHLHKIFRKLEISSRSQLDTVLADRAATRASD